MITNAEIIRNFITEVRADTPVNSIAMNLDWVYWMLNYLAECERLKARVNPEYLRAKYRNVGDSEPTAMFYKL